MREDEQQLEEWWQEGLARFGKMFPHLRNRVDEASFKAGYTQALIDRKIVKIEGLESE